MCVSCKKKSRIGPETEHTVSTLRGKVGELRQDNDRLSAEVSRLTDELDAVSSVVCASAHASQRREDVLDRQLRRLHEKLDVNQRAVCERDEILNNRNVELVFLAGQLVKVGHGLG